MKARLSALGFDGTDEQISAIADAVRGDVSGNILYPGVDYSLPAGFGPGTAAAINGAMAACAQAGGGIVHVPATDMPLDGPIDNKYARVLLRGAGGKAGFHDGGTPTYGTRIIPTFAGTVLKHRTPFASELGGVVPARNDGGGFKDITVLGNNIATRLLEVTSVWFGTYDVFLSECVGAEAALFTCGISGTDIAEAADIQNMLECSIAFRQIAEGANCDGVVFSGSAVANVSKNFNVYIGGQHKNGHAFRGRHCDNNDIAVNAYRASGGTGRLIHAHGVSAALGGCYDNLFTYVSGGGPIYAEGTGDVGVSQGNRNSILFLDSANSTPVPTAGTGAKWRYEASNHARQGGGEIGLVVGNNVNQVGAGMAEIGSESVYIRNGSSNHVAFSDGTNKWGVSVDGSGNFRVVRALGTGYFDVFDKMRQNYSLIVDGVSAPNPPAGYAAIYVDTTDGDLKIKFADGTIKTIVTDT